MSDKIRHSGKLADTWLNRCEKRFNFRLIKNRQISRNISRLEIAISNQDKIWNPSYSVEIGSRDRKSRPESNMEPFWYLTGPEIDKFKQNLWNKHPKISIDPNFGRPGPVLVPGLLWKYFPRITNMWLKHDQNSDHFLVILGKCFQNGARISPERSPDHFGEIFEELSKNDSKLWWKINFWVTF